MSSLVLLLTLTVFVDSERRDAQSMNTIDDSLAVVGRIFIYSLPKERELQAPLKVSGGR